MNPDLSSLIAAARSIGVDAKTFFGGLDERQLNWKPNQKSWSVGQCLEHLIVTNRELLRAVKTHVDGTHRKTIFERWAFGSGYFGGYVLKAVQPENPRKSNAPKVFRPTRSRISGDVVERFTAQQAEAARLMEQSAELDLEKTIVTSPVARFVTYSMLDAFKILVNHERRHFRQAKNLMKMPDFPESSLAVSK